MFFFLFLIHITNKSLRYFLIACFATLGVRNHNSISTAHFPSFSVYLLPFYVHLAKVIMFDLQVRKFLYSYRNFNLISVFFLIYCHLYSFFPQLLIFFFFSFPFLFLLIKTLVDSSLGIVIALLLKFFFIFSVIFVLSHLSSELYLFHIFTLIYTLVNPFLNIVITILFHLFSLLIFVISVLS